MSTYKSKLAKKSNILVAFSSLESLIRNAARNDATTSYYDILLNNEKAREPIRAYLSEGVLKDTLPHIKGNKNSLKYKKEVERVKSKIEKILNKDLSDHAYLFKLAREVASRDYQVYEKENHSYDSFSEITKSLISPFEAQKIMNGFKLQNEATDCMNKYIKTLARQASKKGLTDVWNPDNKKKVLQKIYGSKENFIAVRKNGFYSLGKSMSVICDVFEEAVKKRVKNETDVGKSYGITLILAMKQETKSSVQMFNQYKNLYDLAIKKEAKEIFG